LRIGKPSLFPLGNRNLDSNLNYQYYYRSGMKKETQTTPQAIGSRVQQRRNELGLNQAELAMSCGTGARFISDLENGKETCQLGKSLQVLAALGLQVSITTPNSK
jgi:HTH-type transcriptional regulator / antitoxin HipB